MIAVASGSVSGMHLGVMGAVDSGEATGVVESNSEANVSGVAHADLRRLALTAVRLLASLDRHWSDGLTTQRFELPSLDAYAGLAEKRRGDARTDPGHRQDDVNVRRSLLTGLVSEFLKKVFDVTFEIRLEFQCLLKPGYLQLDNLLKSTVKRFCVFDTFP